MRRRWKLVALAAGAVVVLVVAGIVVIKLVQGNGPAPLSLSTPSTAPGTTSPPAPGGSADTSGSSVAGVWKVSSGSQAGYRVKETLFGQSATAVGRTTAVSGSITIEGTSVTKGSFSVDLTKVSSDRSQRDGQFRGRIMNVATYPTATFTLSQPIALGALPAEGAPVTAKAVGTLAVHGATRPVTFTVSAQRSGSTLQVNGSIPIVFADYGIDNPSGGPATTEDHGTMEFLINFTRG